MFSLVRTCPDCALEKIVIEGISYLIKHFGTCTCNVSLVWLKETAPVAAATFQLKEKLCNNKFFHCNAKNLAEKMESKLEQYCKGSNNILIQKDLSK